MVLFSLILVIKFCRNSPKNEEKSKNDLKVEFVCFGDELCEAHLIYFLK